MERHPCPTSNCVNAFIFPPPRDGREISLITIKSLVYSNAMTVSFLLFSLRICQFSSHENCFLLKIRGIFLELVNYLRRNFCLGKYKDRNENFKGFSRFLVFFLFLNMNVRLAIFLYQIYLVKISLFTEKSKLLKTTVTDRLSHFFNFLLRGYISEIIKFIFQLLNLQPIK